MKALAPHRNIIAVLIIAVAIIVSTVIAVHNPTTSNAGSLQAEQSTSTEPLLQIGNASSTSWQQALLEGIYASSSDENGEASLAGTSSEQTNLTDSLSLDLLSQFSALENANNLTDDSEQALANNLISNYDPSNQLPLFTLNDIIIIENPGPQDIKKYANTFALIEKTRLGFMMSSLQGKPDAHLISQAYTQIAADLKQVPVPAPIADLHLAAINNYETIATSLESIINYQSDPAQALFALKQYQDADTQRETLYTEFAAYFQENGILFNENEPGYAWTTFQSE